MDGETTAMTLTNFLAAIGDIIAAIVDWMTSILGFITSNPILWVGIIGILFVSFTVGIVLRLFRS